MQLTDPKSTTLEGTVMPTARSGEMFTDLTTEEAATVNGAYGYGYGYGYGYRTVSYYRPYRRSYYGGRRGYRYGCY